jgi:hypothetical protein
MTHIGRFFNKKKTFKCDECDEWKEDCYYVVDKTICTDCIKKYVRGK